MGAIGFDGDQETPHQGTEDLLCQLLTRYVFSCCLSESESYRPLSRSVQKLVKCAELSHSEHKSQGMGVLSLVDLLRVERHPGSPSLSMSKGSASKRECVRKGIYVAPRGDEGGQSKLSSELF